MGLAFMIIVCGIFTSALAASPDLRSPFQCSMYGGCVLRTEDMLMRCNHFPEPTWRGRGNGSRYINCTAKFQNDSARLFKGTREQFQHPFGFICSRTIFALTLNDDNSTTGLCLAKLEDVAGDDIAGRRLKHRTTAIRLVDLSGNHFRKVPNDALRKFKKLKYLYLSENDIRILQNDSLAGLDHLEILDVQENQINLIESATFSSLLRLRILKLDGNRMTSLDLLRFSNQRHLTSISASHNYISELSVISKKCALSLHTLDLSFNLLTELHPYRICEMHQLRSITLRGNRLVNIQDDTFKKMPALRFVDLADNRLESISKKSLAYLRRIHTLILRGNSLTSPDAEWLLSIMKIYDAAHSRIACHSPNGWDRSKAFRVLTNGDLEDVRIDEAEVSKAFENICSEAGDLGGVVSQHKNHTQKRHEKIRFLLLFLGLPSIVFLLWFFLGSFTSVLRKIGHCNCAIRRPISCSCRSLSSWYETIRGKGGREQPKTDNRDDSLPILFYIAVNTETTKIAIESLPIKHSDELPKEKCTVEQEGRSDPHSLALNQSVGVTESRDSVDLAARDTEPNKNRFQSVPEVSTEEDAIRETTPMILGPNQDPAADIDLTHGKGLRQSISTPYVKEKISAPAFGPGKISSKGYEIVDSASTGVNDVSAAGGGDPGTSEESLYFVPSKADRTIGAETSSEDEYLADSESLVSLAAKARRGRRGKNSAKKTKCKANKEKKHGRWPWRRQKHANYTKKATKYPIIFASSKVDAHASELDLVVQLGSSNRGSEAQSSCSAESEASIFNAVSGMKIKGREMRQDYDASSGSGTTVVSQQPSSFGSLPSTESELRAAPTKKSSPNAVNFKIKENGRGSRQDYDTSSAGGSEPQPSSFGSLASTESEKRVAPTEKSTLVVSSLEIVTEGRILYPGRVNSISYNRGRSRSEVSSQVEPSSFGRFPSTELETHAESNETSRSDVPASDIKSKRRGTGPGEEYDSSGGGNTEVQSELQPSSFGTFSSTESETHAAPTAKSTPVTTVDSQIVANEYGTETGQESDRSDLVSRPQPSSFERFASTEPEMNVIPTEDSTLAVDFKIETRGHKVGTDPEDNISSGDGSNVLSQLLPSSFGSFPSRVSEAEAAPSGKSTLSVPSGVGTDLAEMNDSHGNATNNESGSEVWSLLAASTFGSFPPADTPTESAIDPTASTLQRSDGHPQSAIETRCLPTDLSRYDSSEVLLPSGEGPLSQDQKAELAQSSDNSFFSTASFHEGQLSYEQIKEVGLKKNYSYSLNTVSFEFGPACSPTFDIGGQAN